MISNNRLAIIDLGSNTFHLIIIEKKPDSKEYITLYRERQLIYLAKNGINAIDIKTESRALKCLAEFGEKINEYKVDKIQAVGTAAMRMMKGKQEFINKIKSKTGLEVIVISGKEEARLIYTANQKLISSLKNMPCLIMDIGGGSVEFILCDQAQMYSSISLNIGISEMRHHYGNSDPVSPHNKSQIHEWLNEEMKEIDKAIQKNAPVLLLGTAGPFEIVDELIKIQEKTTVAIINKSVVLDCCKNVLSLNLDQRLNYQGMPVKRADLSKESFILIEYVLHKWESLEYVKLSPNTLKEGLIFEFLD